MIIEVDFYYYPDENIIRDSDGNIIYDIFRFITPNQLLILKDTKQTITIESRKFDAMIFVHYLEEEY